MNSNKLSDQKPKQQGPGFNCAQLNPFKKETLLNCNTLTKCFQYSSAKHPVNSKNSCEVPQSKRAQFLPYSKKQSQSETSITSYSRKSQNPEDTHLVLDYNHPDKLFPYAGILNLSQIRISKTESSCVSQNEIVKEAQNCLQCEETLADRAILRFNNAEILPSIAHCSLRSEHARPHYFGSIRFKRNDIRHFRVLSSGFYFSSTGIMFSSEPLCILFSLSFFAFSFCGAVFLTFHPVIILIKPPATQSRHRSPSFSKSSKKSLSKICPKQFFNPNNFMSFKPQLTAINLAKATGYSKLKICPDKISFCDKAESLQELSQQKQALLSKLSKYVSVNNSKNVPISLKSPDLCLSCVKHFKITDSVSQNEQSHCDAFNLGKSFDQEQPSPFEKDLSTFSPLARIERLQKTSNSMDLGTRNLILGSLETPLKVTPSRRPNVEQNRPFKQSFPSFPSFLPFDGKKFFPIKHTSPHFNNKFSSKLRKVSGIIPPKIYQSDVTNYYKKTSVLKTLHLVLDMTDCRSDDFRIKKSFLNRLKFSGHICGENKESENFHESLFRKSSSSGSDKSNNASKFPQARIDSNLLRGSFLPFENHYLNEVEPFELRKYRKRLKNIKGNNFDSKKDETTAFGPRENQDFEFASQESSFRVSVSNLNVRKGSSNFKPDQSMFIKSSESHCEAFSRQSLPSQKQIIASGSFSSFNGFSLRSRHSQDFDPWPQVKKFSTLLSHFPLSSSELFYARSVLDFPTFENLFPLDSNSLREPIEALNIGPFSDISSTHPDITDMSPKSISLRFNYLTQENEDWNFAEVSNKISSCKVDLLNFAGILQVEDRSFKSQKGQATIDEEQVLNPIPSLESKSRTEISPCVAQSPFLCLQNSLQGLSSSAEEMFYDVLPFNEDPEDLKFKAQPSKNSPQAAFEIIDKKKDSLDLISSDSPLSKPVDIKPLSFKTDGNQFCVSHNHSATNIPSPFISAYPINTADEFSFDSNNLAIDREVDEYPKSILLASGEKDSKSNSPNKVRFNLKSKAVNNLAVPPEGKMLSSDINVSKKMLSFSEESKRQREVRQKISHAFLEGYISSNGFPVNADFKSTKSKSSEEVSSDISLMNNNNTPEPSTSQGRIQIVTLGQDGVLKPHLFQYIAGALKNISNESY